MSEANLEAVPGAMRGEAEATAPATLAEQLQAVQAQLRGVRARMAVLAERRAALEGTAARLLALAGLERKSADFLAKLTEAERAALAVKKPA